MGLLNVNDPAPDFTVTSHTGATVRLGDFASHWVLLWFYPVADTPG